MPALPPAPQKESWIKSQTSHGPDLGSRRRPASILDPLPSLVDRRAHTSPIVAAAAVEETGPVSPTLQRPSNEVIGGAFVGAFLGFLILLLLIKCCRGRGPKDGEKNSTISSSTSTGRTPGNGPLPPPPIYDPPGRRNTTARKQETEKFVAAIRGEPALVVKRKPRPHRPGRHGVEDLESFSSHSDRQEKGRVRSHLCMYYFSLTKSNHSLLVVVKVSKSIGWIFLIISDYLDSAK